jgi:hypothetical protein
MKILEFKRSGIGIIADFHEIPSRFPNQGDRKLGYGDEGLELVGDAIAPDVAQAGPIIAKLSSKDILKRNLLSKLQWTEVSNHSLINLSSNSFLSSNLQLIVDHRLNANLQRGRC